MGYESKLYIVDKSSLEDANGMKYAQVVATFDMCVCPTINVLQDNPETDCYFYEKNERVLEDRYGKLLTEATIEEVINLLETDVNDGENYRRLFPLLSALKTFKEQKDKGIWDDDLVILHYGY